MKDEERILHLAVVMYIHNVSLLYKYFTSLQMMKDFLGKMGGKETGTERSLKMKILPWSGSTLRGEEPSIQDFVTNRVYQGGITPSAA